MVSGNENKERGDMLGGSFHKPHLPSPQVVGKGRISTLPVLYFLGPNHGGRILLVLVKQESNAVLLPTGKIAKIANKHSNAPDISSEPCGGPKSRQ